MGNWNGYIRILLYGSKLPRIVRTTEYGLSRLAVLA
jgi:hypothetical protein